ncbi:MAG TPA: S1 RNA-binding domain-containing protein [Patescibacteria group bacterium]|nr:S1 RNA-binding domain-containing protein [Patescibacteria group bacterium]HPD73851.1 S1 RNA-binding domain-containing protein [bacterium]HRY56918.1 S1 RNA-binding domain-containing protein [Patescibacteria group bacterium]
MTKAKKIQKKESAMSKYLTDKDLQVKQLRVGDMIEGVVVSASHKEILVDVGAKSEGIITGLELSEADKSYKSVQPGDKISAKISQIENAQGYIVLSLKKAEKDKKWQDAEEAFEGGFVIDAVVLEYNKGGLLCDSLGLRGFIPLSHLDRVHFANDVAKFAAGSEAELKESLKILSGKTLRVKVIELDKEKNRFVLSEKDALTTYSEESRKKRLSEIEIGSSVEGIVTGIMPFGVFVDLDGVEGLVHISEIAWEKVNHPSNYFKVGQKIKVMVLGIDEASNKLALSVKKLIPNPWETVEEKYPVGTKVKGVVSKIVPFGAFVTLEKGLDGLIHISEAESPLEEGDKVSATVIQVDGANQKLALSTRDQSNIDKKDDKKKKEKEIVDDVEDFNEDDLDESKEDSKKKISKKKK